MDRRKMLEEVLATNPADAFARYGMAMEYANSGEIENALAEFKKLLEANPDYTAGYQMAGQTLLKAGRSNEARRMLEAGTACASRTRNAHALAEMQGMLAEME